ncbi:hypothetical protein CDD81_6581 [Ophiocordyceps australis]|uniref:Protein PBN1 n=1 Tax=Ophiocordyceps australis TaxID=1399860 RepID=A0A2C5XHM2_9HYPO|nr:hypothetical protein CDD81_6581 [Ophiocordyceps australis]
MWPNVGHIDRCGPNLGRQARQAGSKKRFERGRLPTLLCRSGWLGASSRHTRGRATCSIEPDAKMRERVTFVHTEDAQIDAEAITVQPTGLLGPLIQAVRQDRFTLALDELPPELSRLLESYTELDIAWASRSSYVALEPFSSRISPGIHVSYSASRSNAADSSELCLLLQIFGPLDCMDIEAFTRDDVDGSSYFYQELESIAPFVDSVEKKICKETGGEADPVCQSRLRTLLTASSLDISFKSTGQVFKVSALWPLEDRLLGVPGSSERRTEIGIFTKHVPPGLEPQDIGVSGLLTVLGEQKEPSPTLFSFPSRHHTSDAFFSSAYLAPTGLHPTLKLNLSSSKPPNQDMECRPYAYLTLPKSIFADRFQFEDKLFLASKNLSASRYTSLPVDLEAPAYTTKTWGSSVLLELAPPVNEEDESWSVEVPLHLRYQKPNTLGQWQIEAPFPAVFWACELLQKTDLSSNPFERPGLGFERLFGADTVFWHLSPIPDSRGSLTNAMSVPVLRADAASWITAGTSAVVGLGFMWVIWKLLVSYMRGGQASSGSMTQDSKDRKDK